MYHVSSGVESPRFHILSDDSVGISAYRNGNVLWIIRCLYGVYFVILLVTYETAQINIITLTLLENIIPAKWTTGCFSKLVIGGPDKVVYFGCYFLQHMLDKNLGKKYA